MNQALEYIRSIVASHTCTVLLYATIS